MRRNIFMPAAALTMASLTQAISLKAVARVEHAMELAQLDSGLDLSTGIEIASEEIKRDLATWTKFGSDMDAIMTYIWNLGSTDDREGLIKFLAPTCDKNGVVNGERWMYKSRFVKEKPNEFNEPYVPVGKS